MSQNSIKVKSFEVNAVEEYVASAAITPGYLLEMDSNGEVKAHATAGGNFGPAMFALEDELQGKSITDAYADDDPVQVWIPQRGEEVYAILADGNDISIGDYLESAGDGTLQKYTADTESIGADSSGNITTIYSNQIVGMAVEAVDTSASSGAESSAAQGDQRIKVKIL